MSSLRGVVRSSGRMPQTLMLLGLLHCAILSQFSAVPTNAATAYQSNGRKMGGMEEFEGSIARFRQLITQDEFSLRSLLQVQILPPSVLSNLLQLLSNSCSWNGCLVVYKMMFQGRKKKWLLRLQFLLYKLICWNLIAVIQFQNHQCWLKFLRANLTNGKRRISKIQTVW